MYTYGMDMLIRLVADGLVIVIVMVAAGTLLLQTATADRYDRFTRVFMAGITSYIAAKFIGSLWQPEQLRPFERLGLDPGAAYLNNPGFPSDHALLAFFLVFAVWFATRNKLATAIIAVLTLAMCVGRVLALVHTPLDITGSLVIAALGSLWYVGYAKNSLRRSVAKPAKK